MRILITSFLLVFAAAGHAAGCDDKGCTTTISSLYVTETGPVYIGTELDENGAPCQPVSNVYFTLDSQSDNFETLFSTLMAAYLNRLTIYLRVNVGSDGCQLRYVALDGVPDTTRDAVEEAVHSSGLIEAIEGVGTSGSQDTAGLPTTSVASCVTRENVFDANCACPHITISRVTWADNNNGGSEGCTATSDTGSCSATNGNSSSWLGSGACCVCAAQ